MKAISLEAFKTHFSEIIEQVRSGEEITITYGNAKEKIAVIIPYKSYKTQRIRLGLLQDRTLKINNSFKMTEEELLGL